MNEEDTQKKLERKKGLDGLQESREKIVRFAEVNKSYLDEYQNKLETDLFETS